MQKALTQIEFKVADKIFHFVCDPDSSIEHVKEALFQIGKYIGSIEDAIKARQAQALAEQSAQIPADEVKTEAE